MCHFNGVEHGLGFLKFFKNKYTDRVTWGLAGALCHQYCLVCANDFFSYLNFPMGRSEAQHIDNPHTMMRSEFDPVETIMQRR